MKNKLLIFVLLLFSAGQLMAQWTNDTRLNICITDTTMTWITFYQLIQDDEHCAVLVNQDERNGWRSPVGRSGCPGKGYVTRC
ncbi:MAG: hypothetical protein H8E51_00915 [Bacteroidetes bacterium]|nr:hypothetical protein [Bacteroidota bacterium]